MELKEKKVEVIMGDRIVRIQSHMLEDAELLGAVTTKKQIKNPPRELIRSVEPTETVDVKTTLPEMKSEIEVIKEKLTKGGIKFHPNTGIEKLKAKLDVGDKE